MGDQIDFFFLSLVFTCFILYFCNLALFSFTIVWLLLLERSQHLSEAIQFLDLIFLYKLDALDELDALEGSVKINFVPKV